MEFTLPNKKKTFQPLVLFHDNDDSLLAMNNQSSTDPQHRRSLIEQHQQKTKEMLENNAQFWENEEFNCSSRKLSYTTSAIDQSSAQQYVKAQQRDLNIKYSGNKYANSPLNDEIMTESERRSSIMSISTLASGVVSKTVKDPPSILDIQPSTSLPLYSHTNTLSASKLSPPNTERRRSFVNNNNQQSNFSFILNFNEEDEEEDSIAPNTTTFILEPQFQYTYKPYNGKKKRRGNLPKEVTEFLKHWLILHKEHPYPTEKEKQVLADETHLSVNQISNWFINARRRILQPLLESEIQQQSLPEVNYRTSISDPMNPQRAMNESTGATNYRPTLNNHSSDANYRQQYVLGDINNIPFTTKSNVATHKMDDPMHSMYTNDKSPLYRSQDSSSIINKDVTGIVYIEKERLIDIFK
ncbi:MAG: hypothetical protein EXX96DRAFT_591831 [Benjaminiella poitrasii]|nr:MAG: hypothetical protein EXX96DRAFT_591831 [Benjaminiella poitrasii]